MSLPPQPQRLRMFDAHSGSAERALWCYHHGSSQRPLLLPSRHACTPAEELTWHIHLPPSNPTPAGISKMPAPPPTHTDRLTQRCMDGRTVRRTRSGGMDHRETLVLEEGGVGGGARSWCSRFALGRQGSTRSHSPRAVRAFVLEVGARRRREACMQDAGVPRS